MNVQATTSAWRRPSERVKFLGVLGVLVALAVSPAAAQPKLKTYETKYYTLYSDLDRDDVQEATLRITLMAEEYAQRTRGLSGTVEQRLPFYLFAKRSDYEAAGGMPGSAGVFTGNKLMAVANPTNPAATWHTVQHEGFHQFVFATIGGGIPTWANEGLAEYFGEGLFTGDQFLTGFIPAGRLARIQAALKDGKFKSLRDMLRIQPEIWNSALNRENYDQAWSMIHFLAHGENGKYQDAFMGFLRDVSHKTDWERAWSKNFGNDVNAFQKRWEEYWHGLPVNPTLDLYAQATALTLTSFYARAFSQRQQFDTFDEFVAAAKARRLKAHQQDWLPPRLLAEALQRVPLVGEWSLERRTGQRLVLCKTPSGTLLEGSFKLNNGRVKSVAVEPRQPRK